MSFFVFELIDINDIINQSLESIYYARHNIYVVIFLISLWHFFNETNIAFNFYNCHRERNDTMEKFLL